MANPSSQQRKATERDLLFLGDSRLWPTWPLLAVVRYRSDGEMDCGVMYDAYKAIGRTGYSASVFLTNIFTLPSDVEDLLALPREAFDTVEEIAAAGWVVD